jgi:hypothetical protein
MIVDKFDRCSTPLPVTLQRRRIVDRAGVSPALAGALSDLAFGPDRREDLADLAALTVARTTPVMGARHG